MSNSITHDCAMLWRLIATKGGWWSILRLTRECAPKYSLQQIEEFLVALWRMGFLAAEFNHREGSVYSFTVGCIPMPEQYFPAEYIPDVPAVPAPRRPDFMTTRYTSPEPNYREGAQDFRKCPSLHQGQRFAFKGIANV